VILLALDGLEYNLVVRWHLKNLMQNMYGYIDVSKYYVPEVNEILTPNVWASFLTGSEPEVHGAKLFSLSRFESLEGLRRRLGKVLPYVIREPISKMLRKMRLIVRVDRDFLRRRGLVTIFDEVKSIVLEDFPVYNPTDTTRDRLLKAVRKGLREYVEECWRINKERRVKLLSLIDEFLNGDYELLGAYFDIADKVGHVYYGRNMLEVMKAYFFLNKLAYEVRTKVHGEAFVVIVSDHGMEPDGKHSPRAFFSFSHRLGKVPKEITEFKQIILDIINDKIRLL
jgi:hypothetical protein